MHGDRASWCKKNKLLIELIKIVLCRHVAASCGKYFGKQKVGSRVYVLIQQFDLYTHNSYDIAVCLSPRFKHLWHPLTPLIKMLLCKLCVNTRWWDIELPTTCGFSTVPRSVSSKGA